MKIINQIRTLVCLLVASLALHACSDSLDEHTAVKNSKLEKSLAQRIAEEPELSEFYALLEESGYDDTLNSSKSYTVWAPSNEAMAGVPSEMLNNAEQVQRFVSNHISLTSFSTDMVRDTLRIQMLSEKYEDFLSGTSIGGATINLGDQYAANGIYHIIDGNLAPQFNIWEYIVANPGGHEQNEFISSLTYFDLFNVEQGNGEAEEIDETPANELLRSYDLNDEQERFTYFVMADEGYRQEKEKLVQYSKRGSQDSTQMLAQYNVIKDLVFEGAYTRNNLPETLTSLDGVVVPLDQVNFIGEPLELSNGIVYLVERVDVSLENKLVPVIIEGETPWGFSHNRDDNVFYRERVDPSGIYFEDLVVQNHGVANFAVNYRASQLYSTTYEVYFRAVNDFEGEFKQRVRIGGHYVEQEDGTVELIDVIKENEAVWIYENVYEEIYAGDFTLEEAGNINRISLLAENTTSDRLNPLTLDYMRLVPIIE